MTNELTESPNAPERVAGYPPYPASVVDQFLAWVGRPIPAVTTGIHQTPQKIGRAPGAGLRHLFGH